MTSIINAYKVYNAKSTTKCQYGAIFFDETPSEDILKVLKRVPSEDGGESSSTSPKRRCFFQPRLLFSEGVAEPLATTREALIPGAARAVGAVHRKGWLVKEEFFDEVMAELVDHINEYKFLATEPLADEYRLAEESLSPSSPPSSSKAPSPSSKTRWELRIFLPQAQRIQTMATIKLWMAGAMTFSGQERKDQIMALMDFIVEQHKVFVWSEPGFAMSLRNKIVKFHYDGLSLPKHFMVLFPWDPLSEMSSKDRANFLGEEVS
jgi:hypothetical protein